MKKFYMNGDLWHVKIVNGDSYELVDRTGNLTLGTTDPIRKIIFLSTDLDDFMFYIVLIHELSHCAMISFNLINYIHDHVPKKYWIDMEEFICNFMSDYGMKIFMTAYKILGESAIEYMPYAFEKIVTF